jgi:hypothetical protein
MVFFAAFLGCLQILTGAFLNAYIERNRPVLQNAFDRVKKHGFGILVVIIIDRVKEQFAQIAVFVYVLELVSKRRQVFVEITFSVN